MYTMFRALFRTLVPRPVKYWLFSSPHNKLRPLFHRLKSQIEARIDHDKVYDAAYYVDIDNTMSAAAPLIADSILSQFPMATILDIGCGTGALLSEFESRGVSGKGLEYSAAALDICRERGLNVQWFDLENEGILNLVADLVVSTEVAEHLPAEVADLFVERLTSASRVVVMTAATPGQGGTDHVNEQPHTYWIDKFRARGFRYNKDTSERWRTLWASQGVDSCYSDNVMVFTDDRSPPLRSPSGADAPPPTA
jgi:SAM-dependent methyltransferase